MKWLFVGMLGMAAGAMGQSLPPDTMATVILGAGRAGAWDTKIVVANVSTQQLPITIATQPYVASTCPTPPCNILAAATIPPLGMFTLPSFPESSDPASSNPQAVFVLSPAVLFSERPAVTALATDGGVTCNRAAALPVVPDNPFTTNAVVLPIDRSLANYVNLILMQRLGPDPAFLSVDAFDASGAKVGSGSYSMTTEQPSVVVVDVLNQLGLGTLERGSIHVYAAPQPFPTVFTAVATIVGVDGVQVVQSTRVVDFIPPQ